jgi:hypothetical protein
VGVDTTGDRANLICHRGPASASWLLRMARTAGLRTGQ